MFSFSFPFNEAGPSVAASSGMLCSDVTCRDGPKRDVPGEAFDREAPFPCVFDLMAGVNVKGDAEAGESDIVKVVTLR